MAAKRKPKPAPAYVPTALDLRVIEQFLEGVLQGVREMRQQIDRPARKGRVLR
jgi:hypothetical protein